MFAKRLEVDKWMLAYSLITPQITGSGNSKSHCTLFSLVRWLDVRRVNRRQLVCWVMFELIKRSLSWQIWKQNFERCQCESYMESLWWANPLRTVCEQNSTEILYSNYEVMIKYTVCRSFTLSNICYFDRRILIENHLIGLSFPIHHNSY